MFCRSCWANIADGSPECPKCHADPTATPAGPVPGPRGPAPAPAEQRKGDRQNRLIALVALLVLVLVAGPTAVEWVMERWRRGPSEPGPGGGPTGPGARPPIETAAPSAEPTAPSAGAGGEVALLQEAYALYQRGRVAEACDRYREAATRVGSEEVRRNLGSCLARLGRDAYQANLPEQAVDYYQRALDAYPEGRAAWIGLALAHVKARNPGQAQAVLEQAAGRFPEDVDALSLLAEVQERQGRTREAAETLRRLLAREPGHGRGRALLASIEREQTVEGSYWSQESRHFVVRYEGAVGLDVGRSVVDGLEEAYDSIGRSLGHFPADRIQVGIYTEEVLGEVSRVPAHFIRGLYDGKKIRLNFSKSVAYTTDLSQLVRHEYTHVVIHELSNGRAPVWVHEGLAQVMEGRPPRPLYASIPRDYLTLGGIERLARTMDPAAFTAGYVLTHVAMEHVVDRGGASRLHDFLVRLGQGDSLDQALRQVFGFGADEVEARLLAVAGRS